MLLILLNLERSAASSAAAACSSLISAANSRLAMELAFSLASENDKGSGDNLHSENTSCDLDFERERDFDILIYFYEKNYTNNFI
jgi:hypothetical protein